MSASTQHTDESKTLSAYENMLDHFREISNLNNIVELLHWDQEVIMPKGSSARRGEDTATLQKLIHQRTVSPSLQELLGVVETTQASLSPLEQANLREATRTIKRAVLVPDTLVGAIAKAEVMATEAWLEARKQKSFAHFKPHLEEMLKLKREYADAIRGERSRYDALLDLYEPDETSAQLEVMFDELRPELVSLLDAIKNSSDAPDPEANKGNFPADKQKAFCREVLEQMGFNFTEGRLDQSTHPFCSGGGSDVRITTRYTPDSLDEALFGSMHEAGHGLYEQGIDRSRLGTPTGVYASLGIHESQSRLWENNIGRSKALWTHLYPKLQQHFPQPFAGLALEDYWRSVNHVTPSLIRTESDEVTYNLHIILRFHFEKELLEGRLAVADLPEAWNARYKSDFGITPPDDTQGCLQDIHWAAGLFGYFPTYTLGNLYAAQLMETMEEALGVDALLAKGELGPITTWLRENVHQPGRIYPARALVERVTGKAPSAQPFVTYLKKKYGEVYRLNKG